MLLEVLSFGALSGAGIQRNSILMLQSRHKNVAVFRKYVRQGRNLRADFGGRARIVTLRPGL